MPGVAGPNCRREGRIRSSLECKVAQAAHLRGIGHQILVEPPIHKGPAKVELNVAPSSKLPQNAHNTDHSRTFQNLQTPPRNTHLLVMCKISQEPPPPPSQASAPLRPTRRSSPRAHGSAHESCRAHDVPANGGRWLRTKRKPCCIAHLNAVFQRRCRLHALLSSNVLNCSEVLCPGSLQSSHALGTIRNLPWQTPDGLSNPTKLLQESAQTQYHLTYS